MADRGIKRILLEMGLYSLGIALAGSESELIRLFKDEFSTLVGMCQK